MAKKWISKIKSKPAFVFWAVSDLAVLVCAYFREAPWQYATAVICSVMAVACWTDKADSNNNNN